MPRDNCCLCDLDGCLGDQPVVAVLRGEDGICPPPAFAGTDCDRHQPACGFLRRTRKRGVDVFLAVRVVAMLGAIEGGVICKEQASFGKAASKESLGLPL